MALTYVELEHVQLKQHMAYLGVVKMHGQIKARSVAFVGLIKCFGAKVCQFFTILDIVTALITCYDA